MSSAGTLVSDLPEPVANTTVATWYKKPGGAVVHDEMLVEIETDKVVLEVPASADGILDAVLEDEGTTVTSRQILGRLRKGNSTGGKADAKSEEKAPTPAQRQQASLEEQNNDVLSPTVRCLPAEHNLDANAIKGTGIGDHLTREDMGKHLAKAPVKESAPAASAPTAQSTLVTHSEKRVPITRPCKRVAERLLETKSSTAMLTALDEVNMKPIVDPRKRYGEAFEKRRGIRLGFMSFYMKAVVGALKRYLEVNASVDGNDVVYHNYFDINMAVSASRGLVTLVLRDVGILGMTDVEKKIRELTAKGRDSKLTVEDLTGGNFTITNDGVFGSPMSTSIISPPQSAIPGMHVIKDRPTAAGDQVEILSMMYLALSYDRRLIDGRESVGFLVTIKELLEDPTRPLLNV